MKIINKIVLLLFVLSGYSMHAQDGEAFKGSLSAGMFMNLRGVLATELGYGVHPNIELTLQAGYMDRAKNLETGTYGTPFSGLILYGNNSYNWYRGARAGLGLRFNSNRQKIVSFSLGSSFHYARLRHSAFYESTREEFDPNTFEYETSTTYSSGSKESTHLFLNVDLRTRFQVKFIYLEVSWLAEIALNEDEDIPLEGDSPENSMEPLTRDMILPLGLGVGVHFNL